MHNGFAGHGILDPFSAPYLGLLVCGVVGDQTIPNHVKAMSTDELIMVAAHIAGTQALLPEILTALDIVCDAEPSWWVTRVLPVIKKELDGRRGISTQRRKGGPVTILKSLDISDVALRFTNLTPAGSGKSRGLCPMHQEKTPSFYVYTDSQKWRCFGACASGGDVIDLLQIIKERGHGD